MYLDADRLHIEGEGICGPGPRYCQLRQPLFGDQRARASKKIGHKGKNLGNFCFLQMGDQYRFQGPGFGLRKVGISLDMEGCGGGYVVRGHLR